MGGVNVGEFARLGLGFGEGQSQRLEEVLRKGCVVLGIVGGIGLTMVGLKDLERAGQGYGTPKRLTLAMILGGLGVGVLTLGGMCTSIKLKIMDYIAQYPSTEAAVGALTPTLKVQLKDEALKLLQLEQKINELYESRDELKSELTA